MLIMTISTTKVSAAVDWSDDFSDGNYNGWTVMEGSFDAPTSPRYCLTAGPAQMNMIYHPSTQVHGTWILEMYEDDGPENEIEAIFMVTGTSVEDFEGYSIHLRYNPDDYGITFYRWNYSSYFDNSAKWTLFRYSIWTSESPTPDPSWHRYNITRTDNGTIYVLRDDELIITSTPDTLEWEFDEVFNTSDKFIIRAHSDGTIDTVVVGTDLPPITTPIITTTTPTLTTTTDTTTTKTTSPGTATGTITTTGTSTPTETSNDLTTYVSIISFGGVAIVIIAVIVLYRKKG